jgi:tRNA(fMet)-specific endonuclease VapC
MNGKRLLDTNIVIALFADEATVKDNLAKVDETFVPSIVIGELIYGAYKSSRSKENITRINEFADNSVVLGCDTGTARHYGEIKNILRLKGNPIPENDIWIAATALQHGLTLITRDSHFDEIEHLKVEVW